MSRIRDTLLQSRAALKQALNLDEHEASLEAHVLLGHVLDQSRAYLLAHGEDAIEAEHLTQFQRLLQRRLEGEPIAYLLGEREFFGLSLRVTSEVLIPRPDTELLVELALALIPKHVEFEVLDLGTGSGAVALAIAKHLPACRVWAVDQSPGALAIASENTQELGIHNCRFLLGDWFSPLEPDARFDLIVGNPPYIADKDPHLGQGDLRFEPRTALSSGPDGLDAIRLICQEAPTYLKPGGWLLLEHGFEQGTQVRSLLSACGFQHIFSHRDLADLERVSGGQIVP